MTKRHEPPRHSLFCALIFLVCAALFTPGEASGAQPATENVLPEFEESRAERWINSEPLTVDELRGRVILVEFWTFGCSNCVRSIPWVEEIAKRYADRGLVVVGVHAPEFDHERIVSRVRKFVRDQDIRHPVLVDNDFDYWRRLDNRYWPAFYLVDRAGIVRHVHIGETHAGTERAARVEELIEALLDEPADAGESRPAAP